MSKEKYKVLDLFCGAGGLSLGFKMAGFEIIGGIEFDSNAMNTHNINFPCKFNKEYNDGNKIDITKLHDKDIEKYFKNKVDIIIGGPPCQGFSNGNMQQSEEERREKNKLFYEFIRFVEIINPRWFLMENVPQILTRNNGYAKKVILDEMEKLGYTVKFKVLNASEYGVPQKRKRAFFIGNKNDLKFDFHEMDEIYKVNNAKTVNETLKDLEKFDEIFEKNTYNLELKEEDFPLNESFKVAFRKNIEKSKENTIDKIFILKKQKILSHNIRYPKIEVQERMIGVPEGGNWRDVKDKKWVNHRNNRHSSAYRRLKGDEPSVTIDTGHMNYFHPKFNRVPTVRESARLQSFPDDFIFTGTATSQFRQVGNAVPPLLAKAIAKTIKKYINGKIKNKTRNLHQLKLITEGVKNDKNI